MAPTCGADALVGRSQAEGAIGYNPALNASSSLLGFPAHYQPTGASAPLGRHYAAYHPMTFNARNGAICWAVTGLAEAPVGFNAYMATPEIWAAMPISAVWM